MRPYRVPHSGRGSLIGLDAVEAILRTLQSDTLAYGPVRDEFEKRFAAFVGSRYGFTTSSCTAALYVSAQLLGLAHGDEVITTPQSFWATIRPLQAAGVTLRFADIDPNSLNLDPLHLEKHITDRTRAIYLVHMGGLPADMDAILAIARKHRLYVVEDCAHAVGATYKGRPVGSLGDIGCFSFHSVKNMSTLGEGGMITFSRDDWAEMVRPLRSIGVVYKPRRREDWRIGPYVKASYAYGDHSGNAFEHDCEGPVTVGQNYRLSEPAAAVGITQLRDLGAFNERRREIASLLNDGLEDIEGIRLQHVPAGYTHAYHLFVFFYQPRVAGTNREKDELIRLLDSEERIQIINRFFPLHLLPEIRAQGHAFGECPVAERTWFEEHINLPIYPMLTDQQVAAMVDAVRRAVGTVRSCPEECFV